MRRKLAALVASALCSCAPLTGPLEAPLPGDKIADAQAAMEAARTLCHVARLEIWLSPYRWRVARQGGIWHVRVPDMHGALGRAYVDVDIRAGDGTAPQHCIWPFEDTVVLAGAN